MERTEIKVNKVVSCFLESGGKILILRRSEKVGTYRGKWAGVTGYIENTQDEQALKEIEEETGLKDTDVELVRKGKPLEAIDNELKIKWVIYPYLFHVNEPEKIRIDWEHVEMKWILPEELAKYKTVPRLNDALKRVLQKE
ncbi:MAG: NUDIX pyrophosphatase [bacterium]|nr:NUDIX pyrophosphatase [bacterium]